MLLYTFFEDFQSDKDKYKKNSIINSCYFYKNNPFNKNLFKIDYIYNKIFFNNKNKEELIFISEKKNKSSLKIYLRL